MSKTAFLQAELESTRARAALYDNGAHTVVLQPGARHDFIIRHDVKDVGQHTLTCSAAYTLPDGERRMLPQNFKFSSSNPLSVRTKVRLLHLSNAARRKRLPSQSRRKRHVRRIEIPILYCEDKNSPSLGKVIISPQKRYRQQDTLLWRP